MPPQTRRLIESWLPIGALGEESVRERRSMTSLPPTYYLHVWWARRPLVASRAAVMASLLPASADRDKFMHMLGIHGDPVATRARIDRAQRTGEDLGLDVYGYKRAFGYVPNEDDRLWLETAMASLGLEDAVVLDPTAGGGSIPFETARVGVAVLANDLNPVAATILRQAVTVPIAGGAAVGTAFKQLAARFVGLATPKFRNVYPPEPDANVVEGYLWARTITCPHCDGLIPLSPNWRLAPDGTGVRLRPNSTTKRCTFDIVTKASEHSEGTVSDGDALCPYPGCGRVVDGAQIKQQAQAGQMGEQLYAVVFKRRIETRTKAGKRGKDKWERGYRAPQPQDDNSAQVAAALAEKLPEWLALDVVPTEELPAGLKTTEPLRYGTRAWRDLFSPRQLLGHCIAVETFRELVDEERAAGRLDDATRAAAVYLSFSLDKMLNYNSRMSVWMSIREVIANTFNRHDFAFCWSHAEMAVCVEGAGYDWAIAQTGKCIRELAALAGVEPPSLAAASLAPAAPATSAKRAQQGLFGTPQPGLFDSAAPTTRARPPVTVTCRSGDDLPHIGDASVDAVVMDPQYYDNVMYAELSDFFYVWLKRTAGYVSPEFFTRRLTDKDNEAVANPAKFAGQRGAKALAGKDYQERMARIIFPNAGAC